MEERLLVKNVEKISKGFEIILKLKLNKRNKGVCQHCSPTHKILSFPLFLCFGLFFLLTYFFNMILEKLALIGIGIDVLLQFN